MQENQRAWKAEVRLAVWVSSDGAGWGGSWAGLCSGIHLERGLWASGLFHNHRPRQHCPCAGQELGETSFVARCPVWRHKIGSSQ